MTNKQYLTREILNVARKENFKRETESLLIAAQKRRKNQSNQSENR